MKKMLIAYYSWSNGNTKAIAEALQKATGADIVRLDAKVPYSDDYDAVWRRASVKSKSTSAPK